MALATLDSVLAQLPAEGGLFPAAKAGPAVTDRWIATDRPPYLTQHWPGLAAIPFGWHEVTAEQAATLQKVGSGVFFGPSASGEPVSDLTALTTGELATAGSSKRRPGRTPRPPRVPRAPRASRPAREPRAARASRAPRPARAPRKPRAPRMARFPRTPRRPYAKTKYDVGWCKRPACNCWTPAGCIGPEMLEAVKLAGLLETAKDCYPGPCYDYGACVTNQCFAETACEIRGIFQFWARQFEAAVSYALPPVVEAAKAAGRTLLAAAQAAATSEALNLGGAPPPTGFTKGCPPGTRWVIGLTGCSCQPFAIPYPPATAEQILAQCGVDVNA
jgi:hypothetical protein